MLGQGQGMGGGLAGLAVDLGAPPAAQQPRPELLTTGLPSHAPAHCQERRNQSRLHLSL